MNPPTEIHPDQRPVALLDIDGVLADVRHRLHHVETPPKDWAAFFAAAPRDPLLPEGAAVAETLRAEHTIVYLTGRPERCRAATVRWLARHGLPAGDLFMRRDSDRRPAPQVKLGYVRRLAADRVVAVLVDDDPDVIAAVSAAGFQTLLADWVPRARALAEAQDVEGRA